MREAEVSHFYWTDVRWEVSEIRVREKPEWQWTTKSYRDRDIEAPQQLMEVLREAYQVRNPNSKLIFPNALGRPEGHFLDAIQKIASRAKINCGECPNCMDHKGRNCHEFGLHKFRRNYARQLDRGKTPITGQESSRLSRCREVPRRLDPWKSHGRRKTKVDRRHRNLGAAVLRQSV